MSSSQTLLDSISRFLHSRRYFLLFCLVISIAAFSAEFFNLTVSIDEEPAILKDGPLSVYLKLDRWGLYVIDALFQWGPPLPVFHLSLAVLANISAFVWCIHLWGWDDGWGKYLAGVFALTYPMIAFVYEFNQVQYGYYIGLLIAVAAASAYLGLQQTWQRVLITSILLIFALSVYQSLLFVTPVVVFLGLASRSLNNEKSFSPSRLWDIVVLLGCMILAVTLHEMISRPIRIASGFQTRYHTVEEFYSWEFLFQYDLTFVIREIGALLLGQRWYIGYLTGVILVIASLTLLFYIIKQQWFLRKKLAVLLLLGCAALSPFALVIVTAQHWPARSFMSLPLFLAGIIYLASRIAPARIISSLSILIVICFFYYWSAASRLFYSNHIIWQRDKLLVNRIVARIESEYGDMLTEGPVPLVIVGIPDRPDLSIFEATETAGGSLLEWDGGSPHRVISLLEILGINYFKLPSPNQNSAGQTMSAKMKPWPAKTSLQTDGKIIIVKLGNPQP